METTNILEKKLKIIIKENITNDKKIKSNFSSEKNDSLQSKIGKKKVMYYSFEIIEFDKILKIVNNLLLGSYYTSIVEKKIIEENETDILENAFKNLNVTKNKYEDIEKHLKDKDNGIILIDASDRVYKINKKFHITMLFLKGSEDEIEKITEIEKKIGDECIIKIKSIGHSDDFITLGIDFTKEIMPYYGNEIKHITIGLRKSADGKKLFPKDSPNALIGEYLKELSSLIEIRGIITKVMNK
jgi:hypothetical protein